MALPSEHVPAPVHVQCSVAEVSDRVLVAREDTARAYVVCQPTVVTVPHADSTAGVTVAVAREYQSAAARLHLGASATNDLSAWSSVADWRDKMGDVPLRPPRDTLVR